jgi:hypothetical protein
VRVKPTPEGALIPIQSSTKSSPMEQDSGNEQKIGSEQEKESSGGELW